MSDFFECVYFWAEFNNLVASSKINYISYESQEKRADSSKRLIDLSIKNKVENYCLTYNYDDDNFKLSGTKELFDLRSRTCMFLRKLSLDDILILDITSMNLRVLGALLNNIKILRFKQVYCVYTEPYRYKKTSYNVAEEYHCNDAFELYKKFKGVTPIPGFLRGNDNNLNEKWVIFLGFEEKRLQQINEQYGFKDIIPVVTLPCFKPGWQNYVFYFNMDFIKNIDRKPEYIAANSFLSSYEYLNEICTTYSNDYIRITPLGTKINALGALLFSLNNTKNIEILYDNPKDEVYSTEKLGNTYVFDISEIIGYKEEIK